MKSTSSVASIIPTTTMINVIDNDVNKLTNNDNVIDNDSKSKHVDLVADKLVAALNNPAARAYYCKVAYTLPESEIWNNLEQCVKGNSPVKLFTFLCQRSMATRQQVV